AFRCRPRLAKIRAKILPGVATPCPAAPPMDTAKVCFIQSPSTSRYINCGDNANAPAIEGQGKGRGPHPTGDPWQNISGSHLVPGKNEKTGTSVCPVWFVWQG